MRIPLKKKKGPKTDLISVFCCQCQAVAGRQIPSPIEYQVLHGTAM